jgi:hypothetical protein
VVLVVLLAGPGLVACERQKGTMEKAGEKIDEAADKVFHPNEGPLEKAGRKTDEAVDEAKKKLQKD